ncbi:MAG: hypothetical protein H0V62_11485 [Gammaproteobacteria bacterium]|nr:hypothetical protein [Gammaproteobacteria bacterium]
MVNALGIRGVNKTLVALFALLFLFLALMAGVFIHMADQRNEQTTLLSLAADQQLLFQRLARTAAAAAEGEMPEFAQLTQLRAEIRRFSRSAQAR